MPSAATSMNESVWRESREDRLAVSACTEPAGEGAAGTSTCTVGSPRYSEGVAERGKTVRPHRRVKSSTPRSVLMETSKEASDQLRQPAWNSVSLGQ